MSEEGELLLWTSCDLSQVAHGDVPAALLLLEDCAPHSSCVCGGGCSGACGYTLTGLGRAQFGTLEGSSQCKAEETELVLGTVWYCAEEGENS